MVALRYGICLRQEVFGSRTNFLSTQKISLFSFYFYSIAFIPDSFYLVLNPFVAVFFAFVSIKRPQYCFSVSRVLY